MSSSCSSYFSFTHKLFWNMLCNLKVFLYFLCIFLLYIFDLVSCCPRTYKICFWFSKIYLNTFHDTEYSLHRKECVFCFYYMNILLMPGIFSELMVCYVSVSLLIFCLILSITDRRNWTRHLYLMDLSISVFRSISFYFIFLNFFY